MWVAKVFANGPQDFFGHLGYLFYAFEHTRIIVQALTILVAASFLYLIRDILRFAAATFTFTHA